MRMFNVRDLDRSPARVLDACDRDGGALIRRRNGRSYRLLPGAEAERVITALPDFAARLRRDFPRSLSAAQVRLADQALRGE